MWSAETPVFKMSADRLVRGVAAYSVSVVTARKFSGFYWERKKKMNANLAISYFFS